MASSNPAQDAASASDPKGKGKAVETPQDVSMDEDDDDSDEGTGMEDEVSLSRPSKHVMDPSRLILRLPIKWLTILILEQVEEARESHRQPPS